MKGDADDDAGQHEGHDDDGAQQAAAGEGAPVEHGGPGHAQHDAHGGGGGGLDEGGADDPPGALAREDLDDTAEVGAAARGQAAGDEGRHGEGEEDGEEGQGQTDGEGPARPLPRARPRARSPPGGASGLCRLSRAGWAGWAGVRARPVHAPTACVHAASQASRLAETSAASAMIGEFDAAPNVVIDSLTVASGLIG